MALVVYLGDEATAAAYRLAGVRAIAPDPADAAGALRRAADDGAELVLLAAPLAARLPVAVLEDALQGEHPLVAIAADAFGRQAPPDLAREVRAALGIEA